MYFCSENNKQNYMKKNLLMALAILAAVTMTSCKSQKTLSQAATVAEPAADVQEFGAPVTYTAPKRTTPTVEAGDRQEKVKIVNDSESGLLKDYNVIVGSFGSKDNAENMKNKMIGRGYKSFLVQNESGMYRVVAGGYDTRSDAASVRDDIRSSYPTEHGTCAEAWLLIPAM